MRSLLLFVVALTMPAAATGADVVVLLTPKCALDPKTVSLSNTTGTFPYCTLNSYKAAEFAEAASVKELKVKGETIVVELLATESKLGTKTGRYDVDGKGYSSVTSKFVALKQPYVVWYVKEAGAAPEKMAGGVATGGGYEIKGISPEQALVRKMTTEELIREGMIEVHERLAYRIGTIFGEKIFVGKALYPTREQIEGAPSPIPQDKQPVDFPLFKPTKIVYGPNGDATLEIELHNRLPVRVTGTIRRTVTSEEQRKMEAAIQLGKVEVPRGRQFDLAPGAKEKMTLTVPPEFVRKAKLPAQAYYFAIGDLDLSPGPKAE
jgi:hypothetical protein